VKEAVKTKPFLGICVGMQCMMSHSEENNGVDCLDVVKGNVKHFGDDVVCKLGERLKVPHMGWNQVSHTQPEHPLWQGIEDQSRFYFVHSYYVEVADQSLEAGCCEYGKPFTAVIARDNVFAVQFHPEKSQKAGLALLKNFMTWDGQS